MGAGAGGAAELSCSASSPPRSSKGSARCRGSCSIRGSASASGRGSALRELFRAARSEAGIFLAAMSGRRATVPRNARRLHPSPPAHPLLAPRRRDPDEGPDQDRQGEGHVGRGGHRPRQHVRRHRLLQEGEGGRHQAHPRAARPTSPATKGRGDRTEKVANHLILLAKNEEGYAQPPLPRQQGVHRRLLLPPAHRQAGAQGARKGLVGAHRLPRRRGDRAPASAATWTTPGARPASTRTSSSPDRLLPRDPVQRAARAGEGQRPTSSSSRATWTAARRHRGRPLHQARGRHAPTSC